MRPAITSLKLALFAALPRRDTKPLAKSLLKKFGSFAEVIHAPETLLREVDGIGDALDQPVLKLIAAAASRVAKGELQSRTQLSSWNDVIIDYCRTSMAFADKEQFRILFLDKRNQLDIGRGAADRHRRPHAIYPREVIKRALVPSATALILVHNHPPATRRRQVPISRDDARDRRHCQAAWHCRARPHHRRQERTCENGRGCGRYEPSG